MENKFYDFVSKKQWMGKLPKGKILTCIDKFSKIDGSTWNRFICIGLNANNFYVLFYILNGLFECCICFWRSNDCFRIALFQLTLDFICTTNYSKIIVLKLFVIEHRPWVFDRHCLVCKLILFDWISGLCNANATWMCQFYRRQTFWSGKTGEIEINRCNTVCVNPASLFSPCLAC